MTLSNMWIATDLTSWHDTVQGAKRNAGRMQQSVMVHHHVYGQPCDQECYVQEPIEWPPGQVIEHAPAGPLIEHGR